MFKVVELEVVAGNPKILARGLVNCGGLNVKVALFTGQNGPWVALPTREYNNKEGKRKFDKQVFPVDEETETELQTVVVSAYQAAKEKPKQQQQTDEIQF
ncbi:MAG: hypothetical protein AABY22_20070 [Nanoarchaeota archaeon]